MSGKTLPSPAPLEQKELYLLHVFRAIDESDRVKLGQLLMRAMNHALGANFDTELGRIFRKARARGILYEHYKPSAPTGNKMLAEATPTLRHHQ